jgi:hypothetical protein
VTSGNTQRCAGFGLCPRALAQRDGLLPILRQVVALELGVWLAMHSDLASSRRVRLSFDHVALQLAAYSASEPRGGCVASAAPLKPGRTRVLRRRSCPRA